MLRLRPVFLYLVQPIHLPVLSSVVHCFRRKTSHSFHAAIQRVFKYVRTPPRSLWQIRHILFLEAREISRRAYWVHVVLVGAARLLHHEITSPWTIFSLLSWRIQVLAECVLRRRLKRLALKSHFNQTWGACVISLQLTFWQQVLRSILHLHTFLSLLFSSILRAIFLITGLRSEQTASLSHLWSASILPLLRLFLSYSF